VSWRGPDAATDPALGSGVDHAVFDRIVGVDLPIEEAGVERFGTIRPR
jgi:hypothetical protein